MHLVRDVLDKQVVDRQQARIGKADGIVLSISDHGQPRVAFIEMGVLTLARRLNRRLHDRAVAFFEKTQPASSPRPYRIPWSKVRDVGVDIEVDVDSSETPLERWQEWLRNNVLKHIPGGLS
jgi:sporulation protein YlmC with PRC-barrel domain